MSLKQERERFATRAGALGLKYDAHIRPLFRAATTLQRLAEAQCNGDWPADNGERPVQPCERCETCWAPSVLKLARVGPKLDHGTVYERVCPDCRTADQVREVLRAAGGSGWRAVFGGDPRGYVLKIAKEDVTPDDESNGRAESRGDMMGVPA